MQGLASEAAELRGVQSGAVRFRGNSLLVGANSVDESTICEALDWSSDQSDCSGDRCSTSTTSTRRATSLTGRDWLGIELNSEFAALAQRRIPGRSRRTRRDTQGRPPGVGVTP
jgi:hypothetical protein